MAQLQITVDDGPQPVDNALTPILGELAKRRIVAAFFNLGEEVAAAAGAVKAILSNGHVLGNHSWDHLLGGIRLTDSEIIEQFRKTHDEVFKATGVKMKLWRAPRLEQIGRLTRLLTVGPTSLYTFSHCDVQADSKDSQGVTSGCWNAGRVEERHCEGSIDRTGCPPSFSRKSANRRRLVPSAGRPFGRWTHAGGLLPILLRASQPAVDRRLIPSSATKRASQMPKACPRDMKIR